MVVSFKVSKKGSRFRPKPKPESPVLEDSDEEVDAPPRLPEIQPATTLKRSVDVTDDDRHVAEILDAEVSFILNIFPEGYSIVNPSEGNVGHQNAVQDGSKFLYPYDKTSESLFTAIECGRLPSDFLDDITCKYSNGTVVCEVRDYRTDSSESGVNSPSTVAFPSITKASLEMSLDNVVKDITQISDSAWTYGDLMEVESRILKALKPRLCLDPTPNLDRLCKEPTSLKLNLNIPGLRRKRLRQMSGVETAPEGKVLLTRVPENSNFRLGDSRPIMHHPETRPKNHIPNASLPVVSDLLKSQIGLGNQRHMQNNAFATPEASSAQNMMSSYTDDISSIMSSVLGKRGNQDGQLSSIATLNKRGRSNPMILDDNQQQIDGINAPDSCWKNTLIQQPQSTGGGIQYSNAGMQNHPQQMFDGSFNQETGTKSIAMGQQGMRYSLKQEPVEAERVEQSRLQQRLPQQFTRSNFAQAPWNMGQPLGINTRKDEHFQRSTPAQSPRISAAGGLPREFSSGSTGIQFGAAAAQREKSVITLVPAVGVARSLTCTNYSMQQQHQAHMAANWRSNSLPKAPVISGVGSPSVGNKSGPFSAVSSVGREADKSMWDRFSKIEMLTARFQLNCKENKIDEYKGTTTFPTQQLIHRLYNDRNNETFKDETCKMPLSKSLVGGNMNICKTRVLKFVQPEHLLQGNGVSPLPKLQTRMILTEKPSDGTVAMYYGDLDDCDYSTEDEHLPTLPNTHTADLLAAQFCSLMVREGYQLESDHLEPKPINMVQSSGGEMQQIPGSVSCWSTNDVVKPSIGGSSNVGGIISSSSHSMPSARLQPQGNTHTLSQGRLSTGVVSMPMPSEPQPSLNQQQQQNPHSLMQQQLQRSSVMMLISHLNGMGQNSNMQQQLGNHNMTMTMPLQLQLLQQQRKMMIAGNNMVGLQGLDNAMGMEGDRAGTGIVSPMSAAISGMGQNPMSINQASTTSNAITHQLHSGQLTPAHAAAIMATKLRMAQSKTNVPVRLQGANRQIHPASNGLSMLGSGANRAANDMQHNVMAPPKLMSGSGMNQNLYMNQQQLHFQQQMQHHQRQQESTSQLQSDLSPPPPQVCSRSIGMPQQQQQASPQPTPMSPHISSGAIAPESPQTLGSVGTTANFPM